MARFSAAEAIVVGVDPGRSDATGWAMFIRGKLDASGATNRVRELVEALKLADKCAEDAGIPVAVVVETWSSGRGRRDLNAKTLIGMGRARGRVDAAMELADKSPAAEVNAQRWKADLFGGRNLFTGRQRGQWDVLVRQRAHQIGSHANVNKDEAAAVLIGYWGCYAEDVHRYVERRQDQ